MRAIADGMDDLEREQQIAAIDLLETVLLGDWPQRKDEGTRGRGDG